MKVIAKTNYACLAMFELAAQNDSPRPVRIREIAKRHGVPPRFLVQILLQLKHAGLIASVRGAAGGYALLKPPEDISLADVISAVDGIAEEEAAANEPSPTAVVLRETWRRIDATERQMLDDISLADLLGRIDNQDKEMYYI